ncbi:YidH family protein [Thermodesulfobacteriota bacterium]
MQREPNTLELAEERTNWAHERTRLAKERTYAAWFRTGMAAVGIGLAIEKFVPTIKYEWVLEALGIVFVCTGIFIFGMGFKTYHAVMKKLAEEGYKGIPIAFMAILTILCFLGSILALILIILD